MTDTDENVVLAATLLLFYTKNGSQIEFTRYKLTIPNTGTTYPVFTLEGTVKRYADSLVLVHDTAEAYSATIIRAETPFFSIGPTLDSTQYSGAYLTHSSVGEAIAGEILLQRVANDTPIKMDDVPADIQQKLWQTFNKLKPPA